MMIAGEKLPEEMRKEDAILRTKEESAGSKYGGGDYRREILLLVRVSGMTDRFEIEILDRDLELRFWKRQRSYAGFLCPAVSVFARFVYEVR
jgi:hypothetical protein